MSASFDRRFYLVFHNPWLRQRIFYHARPATTRDSTLRAVALSYLDALRYAPHAMHCVKETFEYAIMKGRTVIARWMCLNKPEGCAYNAMDLVAQHNLPYMLTWMHRNCPGEDCTSAAMDLAAKNGHYNVVRWLYEHCRDQCNLEHALRQAQTYRHYQTARYLAERLDHEEMCDRYY